MLYNHEQVLNFLPHRTPFLFIDVVEKVIFENLKEGSHPHPEHLLGSCVMAHYHTRADHPIFAGHFPGRPILPGVIQVEMIAQAASFAFAEIHKDHHYGEANVVGTVEMALLSANECRFRKPIFPGVDLRIETLCTKVRGAISSYEGKIYCGQELMSEASMLASIKKI